MHACFRTTTSTVSCVKQFLLVTVSGTAAQRVRLNCHLFKICALLTEPWHCSIIFKHERS